MARINSSSSLGSQRKVIDDGRLATERLEWSQPISIIVAIELELD